MAAFLLRLFTEIREHNRWNAMIKSAAFMSLLLVLGGCSAAYYNTMERFGKHKRDILVERVEEARDAQQEGQEQFSSALEKYRAFIAFDGGELEDRYDQLKAEFEDSEKAAQEIRDRIDATEDVAGDLFEEWEDELDTYTNATLKRDSQQKLRATRKSYDDLIKTMRTAEKRLDPALNAMRDQVLYLKHNLNAKAVASLAAEAATVQRDIDALLTSMQKSIEEANQFLAGMKEE